MFVASVDPANWSAGIVWVADKGDEEEGKKEEGDAEKDNVPEADANERGYADRRIAWRYDALTFETTVGA